jgi:hypothetical protein
MQGKPSSVRSGSDPYKESDWPESTMRETWPSGLTNHSPSMASLPCLSVHLHLMTLASCWIILPLAARRVLLEVRKRCLTHLTRQLLVWLSSTGSTQPSLTKLSSIWRELTRLISSAEPGPGDSVPGREGGLEARQGAARTIKLT